MKRQNRWPLPTALAAVVLATSSGAKASEVPGYSNSLSFNPLAPALSLLADGLVYEVKSFWSIAIRYARWVHPNIAIAIIPHFAHAQVFSVTLDSLGLKLGPRYSFSEPGSLGAYVLPLALANQTWVGQERRELVSQFQLGLGVEGGYAWGWDHWLVEVGGGLHYSGYVAHSSFDRQPAPAPGWGPLLNLSLGYAW